MCILRGEVGGLILCFESFGVVRVVDVGVCGVVSSLFLAFLFCGFCGGMRGGEWRWVCLYVVVVVRFRVVGIVGRVGSGMSLEVDWVCFLRRERV